MKKTPILFKFIRWLVGICYPKTEVIGTENLPNEPVIIVANHAQLNGPIACEFYMSDTCYTWCTAEMMSLKEVPPYAFKDFWLQKPKSTHWFFKIVSYLIAPLSVLIFNNARTISVYKDTRIIKTLRTTVSKLCDGNNVVIFPEHDVKHNNIIYDFQDKFIDISRLYHKKTGKELTFVPMYIAPKLRKMYIGKPIRFRADVLIEEERHRIRDYLMNEITEIARSLPKHTVIPYRNIPKKLYPTNITEEE